MKGGHSWMDSIHDDFDDDVGDVIYDIFHHHL
jgi:hypothetical protein